jgi:predicted metalloprotease with PDZ domain
MLMDLEIRRRSENAHSFDDVLKTLYRRFPLGGGGYTVEDVERIAGELAGSSMRDFFDAYVFGRQAFDWKRALLAAGLQLDTSASGKPWWGVETAEEGGRTLVRQVVRGSAAYAAGLQIGDEIVALDGVRVGTEALQKRIEEFRLGDTIRLTLFREERQLELPVALLIQENPIVHLTKVAAPTKLQREIYSSWLGAPW